MKPFIFTSVLMTAFTCIVTAQVAVKNQSTNYEAAKWETFIAENSKISAAPPPDLKESRTELTSIKEKMAKLDETKMRNIVYWNAGAPSYRWNQIGNALISWDDVNTVLRTPTSWMSIAIYDATVLAWKEKAKYKRVRPGRADPTVKQIINVPQTYSYPCEHSVTASAAAYVLSYFYPKKADSILQLARAASQSRIDAGVQFLSDVEAGWKIGEQVAKNIIEMAKNDGSALKWDGAMNKDTKKWTGAYPLGIMLAKFTPLVMKSVDQFRPPAPPDFEKEMNELKNFKHNFKNRSIAYYWANSAPGFWSDRASEKMFEYNVMQDAPSAALIYAAVHTSAHDAAIATMDAKYAYWGIRPSQYDTTYKPLIATPPFPGYPSGHALGAGTGSAVLSYFFPADANEFRRIAQECADSRFYAGIHFRSDNEVGLQMGNELGKYVAEMWARKR